MNYKKYLEDQLQTSIEAADHKNVYYALLHLTKELCKEKTANHGTKKIYYISAEFLIGKLLSNNLINLGIYDDIKSFYMKTENLWRKLKNLNRNHHLEMADSAAWLLVFLIL